MSVLIVVVALVAGALGAVLRFATSTLLASRARLPWAVLAVNTAGSLVGGIVIGLVQSGAIGADARLIVLGGFAGGLTTFSTFSVEAVQLAMDGRWRTAVSSVLANLILGLAACVAGFALAGGFR